MINYKDARLKWEKYLDDIKKNKKYIKKNGEISFIKKKYIEMGFKDFDINNPIGFREKLQARRINYTKLMEICADKDKVRDYVKSKIGEKYLIPQYFCKSKVTKGDIKKLPNSFILKTSNGSGTNILIKDKEKESIRDIVKLINFYTKIQYGYIWGEFHYNKIPITIVAEKLILDKNGNIPDDLKVHCFDDGKKKRKIIECHYKIDGKNYKNMYDENWKNLNYVFGFKSDGRKIKKPENIKEILNICDKLSEDTNYVRVDLYNVNGKIYFGELTFIPGAGYSHFNPESANELWGSYMGSEKKFKGD